MLFIEALREGRRASNYSRTKQVTQCGHNMVRPDEAAYDFQASSSILDALL